MKTLFVTPTRGRTKVSFRLHGATRFEVIRDLGRVTLPPGLVVFASPSNSGLIAAFAA